MNDHGTLTESFVSAVQSGDLGKLWNAIENNGDLNASVRPHLYQHALEYLMLGYYDIDQPDTPETGRRMARMLVVSDIDLTRTGAFSDMMSIDNIISCMPVSLPLYEDPSWVDLAAKAVIATIELNIKREENIYTPAIQAMCKELAENDIPIAAAAIEAVHRRVGEILSAPSNMRETFVARTVTSGFWREPLPFAAEDLIVANAAYRREAEEYLNSAEDLEGRYGGLLTPDHVSRKFNRDKDGPHR